MSAVTFSGLASGIDSQSLIAKLVAAEKTAANPLTNDQTNINTQKSIVGSLSSALANLGTTMKALDLDSEVKPQTATTSDGKVSMAVSSSAALGTHSLRVQSLATMQITSSTTFASNTAGVAGTGGLDITVGGVTKSVAWDSTDTLDTIASKITDANNGVTASVLFDGSKYRLMVTAAKTGTAAAPTFTDSGNGLDLSNAANVKRPAKDAVVTIDGVDVTRSTNVIADALAGVTLTLNAPQAAADPDTIGTVALDQTALDKKMTAMVAAYNSVNSALHVQLDYSGSTKGGDTLFGDSTLSNLQGQLGTIFSSAYGGSNLGMIGLSRDKTGALTYDSTKLATALATDPNALSTVFVKGGFAAAIEGLSDTYTSPTTGILSAKTTGLDDRYKSLQDQIDQINNSADQLQTRLQAQFTALEQAMSSLQSQSQQLTAMFTKQTTA